MLDMSYAPSDPSVSALIRLCEKEGGYEKVANKSGLNKDHVWQIINGVALPSGNPRGIGPKSRLALTSAFPNWLATGQGSMNTEAGNVSGMAPARGLVPVISSVRAGTWGEIKDLDLDAEETFAVREAKVGPRAFALRVEGDSMTWEGSPDFPEGTMLIVDPDRSAKAGDYVIAKNTVKQEALFKKLVTDGHEWQLKSLNRDYKPILVDDPAMRVIGVVVEYWAGGKL